MLILGGKYIGALIIHIHHFSIVNRTATPIFSYETKTCRKNSIYIKYKTLANAARKAIL